MNATTNGQLTTAFVRGHRCAQCWGPLVDRNGTAACPKNCQPGGFVTAEYVTRRKHESALERAEVDTNYPQFARPKPTKAETKRAIDLLFGE